MTETFACPICGTDLVECPNCGKVVVHRAAVRQGTAIKPEIGEIGIVDIGWKCEACRHEWGFEVLTDERIREERRVRYFPKGPQAET